MTNKNLKKVFRYEVSCPINIYSIYVMENKKGKWGKWYWEPKGWGKGLKNMRPPSGPKEHYSKAFKTPDEAFSNLAEWDCAEFEIK